MIQISLKQKKQLLNAVDLFLKVQLGPKIEGPIVGENLSELELSAIRKLRFENYKVDAPWLNDEKQLVLEQRLRLDMRGIHFLVKNKKRLVGAVRLLPAPFEVQELAPELESDLKNIKNHVEVNRLVVDREFRGKLVGYRLILTMAHWLVTQSAFQGIVALCRSKQTQKFSEFGLSPIYDRPHEIKERNHGDYRVIAADNDTMFNTCYRKLFLDRGSSFRSKVYRDISAMAIKTLGLMRRAF